jgi:hypothetical protein
MSNSSGFTANKAMHADMQPCRNYFLAFSGVPWRSGCVPVMVSVPGDCVAAISQGIIVVKYKEIQADGGGR